MTIGSEQLATSDIRVHCLALGGVDLTKGCEVAIVSVSSISELKNAYPACFLDTKTFLNYLSRYVFIK